MDIDMEGGIQITVYSKFTTFFAPLSRIFQCQAYSSLDPIGSDHQIVVCKCKQENRKKSKEIVETTAKLIGKHLIT